MKKQHTCPITGQTIPADRYISKTAEQQLRDDLTALPGLLEELGTTITKQDNITAAQAGHTPHSEQPLPYRPFASRLRVYVENELMHLAHHCVTLGLAESHNHATLNVADNAIITLWDALNNNLAANLYAPEIAELIHENTTAILDAIDLPPDQQFHGICRVQFNDGTTCDTWLYTRRGAQYATCPNCHTRFTASELREYYLNEINDLLATATEIERILAILDLPVKIKATRIRKWAQRGQLQNRGTNPSGHPLYSVGEAINKARDTAPRSCNNPRGLSQ